MSTRFCPEERFVDRVPTPPPPEAVNLCRGTGRENRLASLTPPHKGASLVKRPRRAAPPLSTDPAGAGARSPAGRNAPARQCRWTRRAGATPAHEGVAAPRVVCLTMPGGGAAADPQTGCLAKSDRHSSPWPNRPISHVCGPSCRPACSSRRLNPAHRLSRGRGSYDERRGDRREPGRA